MAYSGKSTEQEEFESELAFNMATLSDNADMLEGSNKSFAKSLCSYYEKKEFLSPKQITWAMKLWQEVNALGAKEKELSRGVVYDTETAAPTKSTAAAAERPIVRADGTKLIAAFDKAAEKLKYPHLTYLDKEGVKYKLYRSTFRSKTPGEILITDGVPYPDGKIYAKIMRDGSTVFAEICWGNPELQQFFKKLIENFTEEFAINGKQYNTCCYCGKELTNPPSVHAGYGPICAANYGLPWGEVPEKEVTLDIL